LRELFSKINILILIDPNFKFISNFGKKILKFISEFYLLLLLFSFLFLFILFDQFGLIITRYSIAWAKTILILFGLTLLDVLLQLILIVVHICHHLVKKSFEPVITNLKMLNSITLPPSIFASSEASPGLESRKVLSITSLADYNMSFGSKPFLSIDLIDYSLCFLSQFNLLVTSFRAKVLLT
jgi:hypothetical protein